MSAITTTAVTPLGIGLSANAANMVAKSDSTPAANRSVSDRVVSKASLEAQPAQISETELKGAVDKISRFVAATNTDIQFSLDETSEMTVVRVIDRETKEVIRQIPSEEALQIAATLDKLQGLLVKQKA